MFQTDHSNKLIQTNLYEFSSYTDHMLNYRKGSSPQLFNIRTGVNNNPDTKGNL